MKHFVLAVVALFAATAAGAREPNGLHSALELLERQDRFSGAVVIRGAEGVRFARGYGMADPYAGRRFTPETLVDSASLAKPVTAAAILVAAREGRIDLDAPVRKYLAEFPFEQTTVRHLLAHSAGLPLDETAESLAGKSNAELLAATRGRNLLFEPGTAFAYCNLCSVTLALLVERVTGQHFLSFARERLDLPPSVTIRPRRLADWHDRAIGYRRSDHGGLERADSYEGEAFYGAANLSLNAIQLSEWGSKWWQHPLRAIHDVATSPALIAGKPSGLTWGNWYCASDGLRCHYLGHHEGFHHMLYWDADRRISIAMVSNNSLEPALQQRLQRAIVAFVNGHNTVARRELAAPLPNAVVTAGRYRLPGGEIVRVDGDGPRGAVERRGVAYPAYPVGSGIRYIPGLDVYLAGSADGQLRWLSLYEDFTGTPIRRR